MFDGRVNVRLNLFPVTLTRVTLSNSTGPEGLTGAIGCKHK